MCQSQWLLICKFNQSINPLQPQVSVLGWQLWNLTWFHALSSNKYLSELLPSVSSMNKQGFLIKCVLPVRHSHDDIIHSTLRRLVDDCFQSRDQRLTSLQTKTFLRRPLLLKELLKPEHTHINSAHTLHHLLQGLKIMCCGGVFTWWSEPFEPAASSSPPKWTALVLESQTSAWSTDTAPGHWWTWTPHRCADSTPSAKMLHNTGQVLAKVVNKVRIVLLFQI